jgi:hypothetical protein
MRSNVTAIRRITTLAACLLLSTAAIAQASAPATPNTPVGRWVAEHPSTGGIGSWWDFRPDGTVTQYLGAMVTSPVTHTADTLTSPSGQANTPPIQVKYRIEADMLYLYTNNKETTYTRISPASSSDPLLGKWRPTPPKTPSTNPQTATIEKAQENAIYLFTNEIESIRIPFKSREGTWDAKDHTFKFEGTSAYSFQLSGNKLLLGQPPDNTKTDTYLPDTIFN